MRNAEVTSIGKEDTPEEKLQLRALNALSAYSRRSGVEWSERQVVKAVADYAKQVLRVFPTTEIKFQPERGLLTIEFTPVRPGEAGPRPVVAGVEVEPDPDGSMEWLDALKELEDFLDAQED